MSGQAKQNSDTGELVNHMSLDSQRVAQLVKYVFMVDDIVDPRKFVPNSL